MIASVCTIKMDLSHCGMITFTSKAFYLTVLL